MLFLFDKYISLHMLSLHCREDGVKDFPTLALRTTLCWQHA